MLHVLPSIKLNGQALRRQGYPGLFRRLIRAPGISPEEAVEGVTAPCLKDTKTQRVETVQGCPFMADTSLCREQRIPVVCETFHLSPPEQHPDKEDCELIKTAIVRQ